MIANTLCCYWPECPYFLAKLAFFARFCTIKMMLFFNKNVIMKNAGKRVCSRHFYSNF